MTKKSREKLRSEVLRLGGDRDRINRGITRLEDEVAGIKTELAHVWDRSVASHHGNDLRFILLIIAIFATVWFIWQIT